jgi:hypothetical protein
MELFIVLLDAVIDLIGRGSLSRLQLANLPALLSELKIPIGPHSGTFTFHKG